MQHSLPHITPNLTGQDFEERGPPCVIRVLAAHHNNSDHCSTSGSTSSLGLASGDSQHYLESATSVSSSRCGVKSTTAFPAAAPKVCVLRLLSVRSISTFLLVAILCLVAFLATSPQRNPANRLFVKTHVRAEDHHHHFISADKQIQPQQVSLQSQDGVHDSGKFHNIRCSHPYAPPDELCLQQATNSSVGCRLSLHRVTQRACGATHKVVEPAQQLLSRNESTVHERAVLRDVALVQESQQQGGGLCPCHMKHSALVRNTFVVAMIVTSGDHRIGKVAVFSELAAPSSTATTMAPSGGVVEEVRPSQWALVDAGSCRDSSMFCVTGPIAAKIIAHEGIMLLDGLETRLKYFPSQKSTIHPTADVKEKRSSFQSRSTLNTAKPFDYSAFCDDLRRNINAVGRNITNPRDGLHQRGVPWIVPCRERGMGSDDNSSSRHSIPQLFWTRFFLELNTVLHFPIYPVSVDELGTIDEDAAPLHPNVFGLATLPPLLRFSRMYLAPYFFMGSNQLCFKTTLMSHLWPHVAQKFQRYCVFSSFRTPSIASALSHPYHIAIMKSSSATDWRAFAPSPMFESLMEQNHITPISSYLPLLERMWHVNRAELLVTTWGSTMTTATSLMLPRQWVECQSTGHGIDPNMSSRHENMTNAMGRNATQHNHPQHRLLVLIHPGYCKEVSTLFRTNVQTICHFTVKHPR